MCTLAHSDDEEVCWPRNVGAGTHLQAHTKCTGPLAGPLCVPTEARGSRPLNPESSSLPSQSDFPGGRGAVAPPVNLLFVALSWPVS